MHEQLGNLPQYVPYMFPIGFMCSNKPSGFLGKEDAIMANNANKGLGCDSGI